MNTLIPTPVNCSTSGTEDCPSAPWEQNFQQPLITWNVACTCTKRFFLSPPPLFFLLVLLVILPLFILFSLQQTSARKPNNTRKHWEKRSNPFHICITTTMLQIITQCYTVVSTKTAVCRSPTPPLPPAYHPLEQLGTGDTYKKNLLSTNLSLPLKHQVSALVHWRYT